MSKRTEFLTELLVNSSEFNFEVIKQEYDSNLGDFVNVGYETGYLYSGDMFEDFDVALDLVADEFPEEYESIMKEFEAFEEENKEEIENYKTRLKQIFDREDYNIICSITHVSDDGMVRLMKFTANSVQDNKLHTSNITYWMAEVLDWELSDSGELVVGGCGMDMIFHTIYSLSSELYGDGYKINYGKVWKI